MTNTKKTETPKTTNPRKEYELKNSPYLLNAEPGKPSRITRNYELLKDTPVDNGFVLDFIQCDSPAEAKTIRGWLWNAFAGGRAFEKSKSADLLGAAKVADALYDRLYRERALTNTEHEEWGALRAVIAKMEAR